MLSLDTETTGTDHFHGARPFFVTACFDNGKQVWWEWDVNPLTREVTIPDEDSRKIRQILAASYDGIVLQNAKFDATALLAADITDWTPLWELTHDTLVAGHLLASNRPHNLTDMSLDYLGADIQPWEDRLKIACNEARRWCRSKLKLWMIAEEGLEGMPSAKSGSKTDKKGIESESPWKFDSWLPKRLAQELKYRKPDPKCDHVWPDVVSKGKGEDRGKSWLCKKCSGHRWWIVLSEYANVDSGVTFELWKVMRREMESRDLWEIYLEKMKSLKALHVMETRGVTLYRSELENMRFEYAGESEACGQRCVDIAASLGHDLTLPKSGRNKSLADFVFNCLCLPVTKFTDGGEPSLDKDTVDGWMVTLDEGPALSFLRDLRQKRKKDKSSEYLDAYQKFMIPLEGTGGLCADVYVLHSSINPTGTSTTRVSCSRPNLQQVSKEEIACETCKGDGCEDCNDTGKDLYSNRQVFGPAPGREWYTADAENIELRIPAYESGEKDLIELFERPNDPPYYGSNHILNFSIVYEDVWLEAVEKVGIDNAGPYCKKEYKSTYYHYTKGGDFALQYQAGIRTVDRAFRRPGYNKLKTRFSRLDDLNRRQTAFAEKHGYVETIPDKTVNPRRGYPILCARGDWGMIKSTTPLNYHTQGTAGWWMVKAINRCYAKLEEWRERDGFDGYMCLTVHDELIFDFPKAKRSLKAQQESKIRLRSDTLWRMKVLQRLMEQGGDDIGIPTPVSVEYHPRNWAEGIEV